MKVSIVTLTYKNWRELGFAIESVSTQLIDKEFDVEYLIVDDGTDDFDAVYVHDLLKEKCPFRFQIIQNPGNMGTVKSFNNAIKQAGGDIIIPLSADDVFYNSDIVNLIAKRFTDPTTSILTTIRVPVINGHELSSHPSPKQIALFKDQYKLLNHLLTRGNFISGAATTYRKCVLEKLNYFDEDYRLLEDFPFYVKALANSVRIDILPVKSIKYGMDGISAIGKMNPLLRADFIKLYKYIISTYPMSGFWKRKLYYSRILSREERVSIGNVLQYPEQFILSVYQKVMRIIK